jgi:5-methylcytosine-specific restriction endonuclease McrA
VQIGAASLARGAVPYLRDGQHWLTGQPGSANGRWLGGVTPERQAFYRTDEWKTAVRAVWARADAHCERCGLDYRLVRDEQTFHIHHIVGFAVRELRASVSNLALLCPACHRWVHGRQNLDGELLGDPLGAERAA